MIQKETEWAAQSVPKRSARIAAQRASDVVVLLDLETGRYFGVEGAGDRIWSLCDGDHSVADIVRALSAEYGIDPAIARADAVEFLTQLRTESLVNLAA